MARMRRGNRWTWFGSNNPIQLFQLPARNQSRPRSVHGAAQHCVAINGEAGVTHMEIKALENASRTATVWAEGYDGETHYADVFKALARQCLS